MKKLFTLFTILVSFSFVACSKQTEESPATSTEKTSLPESCENYFNTLESFMKDYPQVADTYKTQLDQTREQWSKMEDKNQLKQACEQANTQFEQVLKSMPPKQ